MALVDTLIGTLRGEPGADCGETLGHMKNRAPARRF